MKKNLILGTGTGYKYEDIKPFLTSLKAIGYKGDVTLLVSDLIDDRTKTELLNHGRNWFTLITGTYLFQQDIPIPGYGKFTTCRTNWYSAF